MFRADRSHGLRIGLPSRATCGVVDGKDEINNELPISLSAATLMSSSKICVVHWIEEMGPGKAPPNHVIFSSAYTEYFRSVLPSWSLVIATVVSLFGVLFLHPSHSIPTICTVLLCSDIFGFSGIECPGVTYVSGFDSYQFSPSPVMGRQGYWNEELPFSVSGRPKLRRQKEKMRNIRNGAQVPTSCRAAQFQYKSIQ